MVHLDTVIQISGIMAQEIVKGRKLNLFFLEEVDLLLQRSNVILQYPATGEPYPPPN